LPLAAALLWAVPCALNAQDQDYGGTGEAALAERYAQWARTAIDRGQWEAAEAELERAADYADVLSDLSCLLAQARIHLGRPRRLVLEALRRALAFNRWNVCSVAQARLLEAETLIALHSFEEALLSLDSVGEDAHALSLKARACLGLSDSRLFVRTLREALDRYPRSPEPARLLFAYASDRIPAAGERELVSLCLRRLPLLVETDPELAFLAAPYIRDADEARRYVAAYRAAGGANPAGIPAALNLGIIDEQDAMAELFREPALDKALLETVRSLLRSAEGRDSFADSLSRFSGTIAEDADRDGYSESRAVYQDGLLQRYAWDADQDLAPDLEVFFAAGIPVRAETAAFPDDALGGILSEGSVTMDGRRLFLEWEEYPSALRAELDGLTYIPRPGDFFFSPLRFRDFLGSSLLYPERDFIRQISRRTLVSLALAIEQPGRTIPGSIERTELQDGVKRRSRERLGDKLVSETEYVLGQPAIQRIDMDLDGRLETIRRYRSGELVSSESDWDGDGVYEYGETYGQDGVIRSWDMDKDGVREQTEPGARIR
jgi:tetratricopeptide (TPR) repeat protein